MKFLRALLWESLQNLPMILCFMVAARMLEDSLMFSLVALLAGILVGNIIMHYTEPKLHTEPAESTLKGTLINIVAFIAIPIPFLFYFTAENQRIS